MTAPASPERPVKDPARARFFAIALVRLSGAVMVLLGS